MSEQVPRPEVDPETGEPIEDEITGEAVVTRVYRAEVVVAELQLHHEIAWVTAHDDEEAMHECAQAIHDKHGPPAQVRPLDIRVATEEEATAFYSRVHYVELERQGQARLPIDA